MTFGPWVIPDNEYMETALRLERGQRIRSALVGPVNADTKEIKISGSKGSEYAVSLSGCTCSDFRFRSLPCKHMLRLALELNLPLNVPLFDPSAAAEYDVEEDISRLESRWRNGQLTTEALSKCVDALRASSEKANKKK